MASDASDGAPEADDAAVHPPSLRGTLVDSIVAEDLPIHGVKNGRLAPGDPLGRFTVLRLLGAGGMGEVFLCHDPDLDRDVAVKLLHSREHERDNGAMRERLLREARAIAKLAHPNVISVHDVAVWNDRVFLAMEYVPGVTLGHWVAERSADWRAIVAVFVQAGRGLTAAHRAGMIHRDFKPDNVLVGDDGRARVLDFGIARAASAPVDDRVTDRWDVLEDGEQDPTDRPRLGQILATSAGERGNFAAPGEKTRREVSAESRPRAAPTGEQPPGEFKPLPRTMRLAGDKAAPGDPSHPVEERQGTPTLSEIEETRAASETGAQQLRSGGVASRSVFTQARDTSSRLTTTGMMIGTPAYMAPEQFAGGPLDARTDQFSFCVALWEAVFGQRPFKGTTLASLSAVVLRGDIAPPPANHGVPAAVETLLRRGLAVRREDRHDDLDALLEQLEALLRPPERRRWGTVGLLAIAATLALAAYTMQDTDDAAPAATKACAGDRTLLAQHWGPALVAAARDRFASVDPAEGERIWQRTEERAERWLDRWFGARLAACRDTHELHRQSDETLELRLNCLDGLGAEFRARTTLWRSADAQVVAKAIESAASMSPPALCGDVARLRDHSVAISSEGSEASKLLATDLPLIRAQHSAGMYKAAAAATEPLWTSALERRDHAAIVLIGLDRGRALEKSGSPIDARDVLTIALRTALTAGMDEEATYAAAYLGSTSGVSLSKYEEGEAYLGIAASLNARHTGVDARSHQVARSHCHFLNDRGRVDEALGFCNQAVEDSIAVFGEESLEYAGNLHNLANNYIMRRDVTTARVFLERAVSIVTAALGDNHPRVASMFSSLSAMEYYGGSIDRAREHCQRAVEIFDRGGATIGGEALVCKISLATIALTKEDDVEALRLADEIEMLAAASKGEVSSERVFVERIRGQVAASRGDWQSARQGFARALEFALRTRAADHPDVLDTAMLLAEANLALGETAALASCLSAADTVLAAQPQSFGSARRSIVSGRHQLALGELSAAAVQFDLAGAQLAEVEEDAEAVLLLGYLDLYRSRLLDRQDPADAQAALLEAKSRAQLQTQGMDGKRMLAVFDSGR